MPVEGEPAVEGTRPVHGGFIVGIEGGYEVLCVGFGGIFYTKVIYAQNEGGRFAVVAPESGGEWCSFVYMGSNVFD